ncbi:MAG: NAD(+)/NADH kinase [candidate division WOR-3 bacterium]|nr:NAD(+)/NADH kinase [candidate division WOR-3 bacterium]
MKIGLIVNPEKPLAQKVIPELIDFLMENKITPLIESVSAKALKLSKFSVSDSKLIRSSQLIIALGGDGTLLRAARMVGNRKIPIMGVNLGGLGFLTEFSTNELKTAITDYLNKNYREENRMVLKVTHNKRSFYVLNDCAVNMGPDCRVIEVMLSTNHNFICKLVADGVVVATPTGSTAYSLAAGGPIVFPTMEAILITPLSPHSLSGRPLIVPATEAITLELGPKSSKAILNLDGQTRRLLKTGEKVIFSKANYYIRLIAPKNKSYYQILRTKMKWSERGE